jgi:hemolysin activation/secretion protein
MALCLVCACATAQSGPAPVSDEQQTILVQDFEFAGNSVVGSDILAQVAAPFQGKQLTLEDLKAVTGSISAYYHKQGYILAVAVLPEQEVSNGVIKVYIFEGRLGKVVINGDTGYAPGYLQSFFNRMRRQGVIRKDIMERAILLMNDLPGMKISSVLQAGEEQGTTDIIITAEKEQLVTGKFAIDNFGSRFARVRANTGVNFLNRLGRGSAFSLNTVRSISSDNLYYYNASYTIPLGADGSSLSFYGLAGDFGVGKEFAILDIQGRASAMGIAFSRTLQINSKSRTVLQIGLDAKNSKQNILGTTSSKDSIRSLRMDMLRTSETASGRTSASFSIQRGLGEKLGGMKDHDPLSSRSGPGADNQFTKFNYEYGRVQSLGPKSMLVARFSGQQSLDDLVLGEQMAIGGVDSVRGYEQAEYLGDSGMQASLELRFATSRERMSKFQLAAFVDWGRVSLKTPALGQAKSTTLTGAGFGLRYNPGNGYFIRTDVGFPLGKKPLSGKSAMYYLQFTKSSTN